MKIFCISIQNKNFYNLKKLGLIPVGLGSVNFDKNWLNDKGKFNISKKNIHFGEYTFHYHIWKNKVLSKNYKDWVGFCSYRRFWTSSKNNIKNFNELDKIIIKKPQKNWTKFDVILGKPLVFKKIKNIKLIKSNLIEVIKKPSMLYRNNTLEDQFRVFHGSYFLDQAIKLIPNKYQDDFRKFLKGHLLHPFNMFICKNSDILMSFYNEIFPWLLNCEKVFKYSNLSGYNRIRIYGFLAERFMPFWFMKNYRVTTNPITFFSN